MEREIKIAAVFSGEDITEDQVNLALIGLADKYGWRFGGGIEDITVEKVKVKYVDMYRDGGTKRYQDENGRDYYQDNVGFRQKGKIFAEHPHGTMREPLNVELEIVEHF